jgi:GcrA cell cycle regulator
MREARVMNWTPEAKAMLRKLWHDGLTTSAIGEKLGCTKNCVVGMRNRMDLPARKNAIVSGHPGHAAAKARRAANIRTAGEMVQAGQSAAEVAAALDVHVDTARMFIRESGVAGARNGARRRAMPIRRLEPAPAPVAHPALRYGTEGCRWPIGEPRKPGFRFCCAPAVLGKPYCTEHAARAYVQVTVPSVALAPRRWVA